jgi:hypothetical protein
LPCRRSFVLPAATFDSIYAVWWLRTQQRVTAPAQQEHLVERIATVAAMYGKTLTDALAGLRKFLRSRHVGDITTILARDLPRWLPEAMVSQFNHHNTWLSIAEVALVDIPATAELLGHGGDSRKDPALKW